MRISDWSSDVCSSDLNAISFFMPQPHSSLEIGKLMDQWYQKYPQFSEEMAKYHMKTVGLRPLESYGMICTTPIRGMEDFKGKRIRAYGFALPALIETLGAVPSTMGPPEHNEAAKRDIPEDSPG